MVIGADIFIIARVNACILKYFIETKLFQTLFAEMKF